MPSAIASYFDWLIRHVDIYTEQTLEKYTESDVFEFKLDHHLIERMSKHVVHDEEPGNSTSSLSSSSTSMIEHAVATGNLEHMWTVHFIEDNYSDYESNFLVEFKEAHAYNVREHLNSARKELIDELNKGKEQARALYESIKHELKIEHSDLHDEDEKRQHLFARLFANKFHFIINTEQHDKSAYNSPFKLYLVELDFYLNKNERDILGHYLLNSLKITMDDVFHLEGKMRFTKEHLLADDLMKYISGLLSSGRPVKPVIRIERERIWKNKNKFIIIPLIHSITCLSIDLESEEEKQGSATASAAAASRGGVTATTATAAAGECVMSSKKFDFSNLKNLSIIKEESRFHYNQSYSQHHNSKPVTLSEYTFNSAGFLRSLENLSMTSSRLAKLSLSSLRTLRGLCLSNCDLQDLDDDAFGQLESLEILHLNHCRNVSHINLNALHQIKWLKINDPDSMMRTLTNLKNNQLLALEITRHEWTLGDTWLSGFPSLRKLKLKIGPPLLETLPVQDDMPNLESLNLEHNNFECMDAERLGFIWHVKKLNLSSNRFRLDRENVFSYQDGGAGGSLLWLRNLTKLKLTHNAIQEIHKDAFRGLPNLELLDLSFNEIKHLDPEVFAHVPNLKHLNMYSCCSHDQLRVDAAMFVHLSRLQTLIFDHNRIGDDQLQPKPQKQQKEENEQEKDNENQDEEKEEEEEKETEEMGVFSSLVDLELLSLGSNGITKLAPNTFQGLNKLKVLDLFENKIEELAVPGLFAHMHTSLEEIYLFQHLLSHDSKTELVQELASTRIFFETDRKHHILLKARINNMFKIE